MAKFRYLLSVRRLVVGLVLAVGSSQLSGCAYRLPRVDRSIAAVSARPIVFYGHKLEIRFVQPRQATPQRPLVIYATGDGGWWSKDRLAFSQMIRWGCPIAGFSAPAYLKHLGTDSDTTTPTRLGRDYERLIAFATQALGLPAGAPVVLVGVSRGADLAVIAASQPRVRERLAGVIAVGLTREEEYVTRPRQRWRRLVGQPGTPEIVRTYDFVPRLSGVPLVVIQSTKDEYVTADQARLLLGPDTPTLQLHAIEARDHSFTNAREALYDHMLQAYSWICDQLAERTAGH